MQLLFRPGDPGAPFVWGVGVEDTFIPQARPGHRPLDEYELTGHDRLWREDIDRIAELGVRAVRYGVPWYKANPAPGKYDWAWADRALHHLAGARGLVPIVDLVHYGTPLWLKDEFLAVDYPARVADYAHAFADRYRGLVAHYTPCNEPAVLATRAGRAAAWPPYRRGLRGHVAVLLAAVRGMVATAEAIRAAQPGAALVHAEDFGVESAESVELAPWVAERQAWRWLPLDLACGRVRPGHPLWADLLAGGALEGELLDLAERPARWDVLGVNFYPWSNRRWRRRPGGVIAAGRGRARPDESLAHILAAVHDRFGLPVMVTETSAAGSMERRLAWMDAVVAGVNRARAAGVPALGLTWFPAFTMVDWRYRRSKRPADRHLLHLGLWDVDPRGGAMARGATPLVEAYRKVALGPVAPIGLARREI